MICPVHGSTTHQDTECYEAYLITATDGTDHHIMTYSEWQTITQLPEEHGPVQPRH